MRSALIRKLTITLALCAALFTVKEAWAVWPLNGVPACTASGDQVTPALIDDGTGGAIVVWSDSRGSSYDIYAQRLNARGRPLWTSGGMAICVASGDQTNPRVIPDGAGGVIAVWQDTRGGELDVYAQRVGPDGRAAWLADGVPLCTAPRNQFFPALAPDGASGAIVAWQDSRVADSLRDVYVQRVNASGNIRWPLDGIAFGSTRGGRPSIATDSSGGAVVAWEDSLGPTESDVYAQRVDSLGQAGWTSGGVPIAVSAGLQTAALLVRTGAGVTIAWEDHRGVPAGIYAQRVDASGSPLWTANGVLLSSASGPARKPALAAGGAGEAIVAWEDYRDPAAPDVYVQKADSLGGASWNAGGSAIDPVTPGFQLVPSIDSDGRGGAVLAWYDFVPQVGSDIYAQHVDSLGQFLWTADGSAVCTASDNQSLPAIVSSGDEGAIVAWQDHRNGSDSDIYAERVLAGGATVEVPAVTLFRQPYPNPFNPSATLEYGIPAPSKVVLRIFDGTGRLVRTLLDQAVPAGIQAQTWDGRDDHGRPAASGIYIAEFRSPGFTRTRKMALVR